MRHANLTKLLAMEESNPRKRPRPVVSCLRCRDKKLKCDRTAPCENCIKAQTSNSCTYHRNNNARSKECAPAPTPTTDVVEDLQLRLTKVEELLGLQSRQGVCSTEDAKQQPIGTVVVKGTRSMFHGQNDRTTLLNQVWTLGRTELHGSTLLISCICGMTASSRKCLLYECSYS